MSNATLTSPPKLHDLKNAAVQMRRRLENQPMPLIIGIAGDQRPVHYAEQIIHTVDGYLQNQYHLACVC